MLAQKPDNTTPAGPSPAMSSIALPADMNAPVIDEAAMQTVADTLLASPHYRDFDSFPDDMNEFLTSPFETPYDDFSTSPLDDSPFSPDLNTPLFTDISSLGVFNDFQDAPLFNDLATSMYSNYGLTEETAKEPEPSKEPAPSASPSNPSLDIDKLYTFSPETPSLDAVDSVNPNSLYPSPRVPTSKELDPSSSSSRKPRSQATGTRKNITSASLVPLDAPTQSRHYATPSATSRKEMPAVFARKRNRSQAFADEEDELAGDGPGPNATEKEQIEWKRRQNTLAARKSRKRKLEHQQMLETRVDELTVEVERWKAKAQTLEQILRSHGVPFSFDESM